MAVSAGFISYAHEDNRMFRSFQTHVAALKLQFPSVEIWEDSHLRAGMEWEKEILDKIDTTDIFILLVSPEFIASKFIYDKEAPAIRRRHENKALVLPVILRPCAFGMLKLPELQAVSTAAGRLKPVSKWGSHSDGFHQAREQIATSIQHYLNRTVASPGLPAP